MSQFEVSAEAKTQLLTDRINALNLEGYQHELNLKSLEALGNSESSDADVARQSIVVIKAAIDLHAEELNNVVL